MRENDIRPLMETLRQYTNCSEDSRGGAPSNGREPFRVLISALLCLQTRDPAVAIEAGRRLLALADTPQAMLQRSPAEIREAIWSIDLSRPRTNHILQICKILVERYGGQVPNSRDELMALPGIGSKTASQIAIRAFNQLAICVDMNVHRITNRWGYVSTGSPEKTETALRAKLPRDYWCEIGEQLGELGNRFCLPQRPRCMACPVNAYCDRVGVVHSK